MLRTAVFLVAPTTSGTITNGGPVETTRITVEPTATVAPAAGACETMWAAGTVIEDCVVCPAMGSSTSPCPSTAALAAGYSSPITPGTKTVDPDPDDTTRLTAEPSGTVVPATGACEMTTPAGTVAEGAVVTEPRTNPAPLIVTVAADSV